MLIKALLDRLALAIHKTPRPLRWLWWVGLFVYFVSPFEIIPDRIGPLGRLDDILLSLAMIWAFERARTLDGLFARGYQKSRQNRAGSDTGENRQSIDPYKVLGLSPDAGSAEIKAAYRKLLNTYHPDKFAHLGKEFEEVARVKTRTIIEAYKQLGG